MSYTINKIQDEMNAAGSHWWDRGSMRWFGTRASEQVYQGKGGIYFVTSEKPPHGGRKFSVRKYNPEAKDIDTIGEFCSMTRHTAHKTAAELAGEGAIVAAEAHKPLSEVEQLALDIERNCGTTGVRLIAVRHLISLAKQHHRMMEDYCSVPGADIYDEDGEPTPRLAKLRGDIVKEAKAMGCTGVHFQGDPRGCTVKLIFPNGETNDWGKEGWCVPTGEGN